MSLFRRFFHRKPPDGLLEIAERVYVFECCFSTDVLEEDELKVYMGGVVDRLGVHFPDASFMVFNFREGERPSQLSEILSEYGITVMDYPRHYEGCPLLKMEMVHHFLRSSESWHSLGQQNLLLMHCERGGWPVLAFMLAGLLIYRKHYTGEQKTLDMLYKQAPSELLQLLSPLNPLPSQLRYLQYISRRNIGTDWPPMDRALTLDCIILRAIPSFDGKGGCRPIFRLYGQDPFIPNDQAPKVLFSTPKKSKSVRLYKQPDCDLVKIDIGTHIQGDVVLECINIDEDLEHEEMMFRVMFNTAFIRSNILILSGDEIDTLWNARDHFPKDFRAEVLLSEIDAAASLISVDLSGGEEKEGLPIEAFAKVQEIFSTIDWLGPKADAALSVIQQIASKNIPEEKLESFSVQMKEPKDSSPIFHDKVKMVTDFLQHSIHNKLVENPKSESFQGQDKMTLSRPSPRQLSLQVSTPCLHELPNQPQSPLQELASLKLMGAPPPPPPPPPPAQQDSLASTILLPSLPPLVRKLSSHSTHLSSPPFRAKSCTLSSTSHPHPPPPPPPPPLPLAKINTLLSPPPPPPPPPPLPLASTVNVHTIIHSPWKPPESAVKGNAPSPPPPPPQRPVSASRLQNIPSTPPPPPPIQPLKESPSVPPVPPPIPIGNSQFMKGTGAITNRLGGSRVGPPSPGLIPNFSLKGRQLLRSTSPKFQTAFKRTSLKPLHWVKVTRAMQGSLWAETQKLDEASRAPEFDMTELESLFSAVPPKSDQVKLSEKSGRRMSLGAKPEKIHLIDLRRANNCEIMLTKVKIPLPDLMSLVLTLDDTVLDADQVDNLIKFCPTKEEVELLKGFSGNEENLGKCEQFFLELMKVPHVESKLMVFSFKIRFHSQVSDLSNGLNLVNTASEEIRKSAKLKRIMQTILSLGNALNQGTARGSAIGFKLDSLLKLTDTRARNNKMTLMHYLCKVLAEKLPELLDFHKDLHSLEAAAKIQLKSLAEEMQAISKGLEKVEEELTASENDGPISQNFHKMLKDFLASAEAEVRSLTSLYSFVGRNADALSIYFGEDPARCSFEQVVSTLFNFVKMFMRAHDENCKQLELEKKKAQKEAENEKMKISTPKKAAENLLQ